MKYTPKDPNPMPEFRPETERKTLKPIPDLAMAISASFGERNRCEGRGNEKSPKLRHENPRGEKEDEERESEREREREREIRKRWMKGTDGD